MTAVALPRSTALTEAGRETAKPLTEDEARELTAQIRISVQELLPLIRRAYQRRADLALGYASWDAYCDAELSGLRMSVADRPEAVAELRQAGMSQRAIGSALGISPATVNRALATVSNETVPDRIVGIDGREQPAARSAKIAGPAEASSTAAVEAGPNLTPDVLRVLADAGHEGMTEWQIAFLLNPADPAAEHVVTVMSQLTADDRVRYLGTVSNGSAAFGRRWALTELVKYADPEAPEPVLASEYRSHPAGRIGAVAAVAPEFVQSVEQAPTFRIVPTDDEKQAAVQRDARGLLRRAVEILAPAHDRAGFAATWARQLGPYDEELSDLIRRATEAMATLDDLIEGAGQ